jgi:hypothetical protein
MAWRLGDDLLESAVGVIMGVEMATRRRTSETPTKPQRTPRNRRRKSPNGAGGVYFNQVTERWMGRYTTEDPETGLPVRKAVYGRTEQEARAKLIKALAARQDEPFWWVAVASSPCASMRSGGSPG